MTALSASAQKVQDALRSRGFAGQVIESDKPTRTSAEAAAAIGCAVGQIAKSILFKRKSSGSPVLVIASGANRIDESKVAAVLGETLGKADAEFVRATTGFVIGGVPPLGHAQPLEILVDHDLLAFPEIWAAAGTPNAVFKLTPDELLAMTGGRAVAVRVDRS